MQVRQFIFEYILFVNWTQIDRLPPFCLRFLQTSKLIYHILLLITLLTQVFLSVLTDLYSFAYLCCLERKPCCIDRYYDIWPRCANPSPQMIIIDWIIECVILALHMRHTFPLHRNLMSLMESALIVIVQVWRLVTISITYL